MEAEKQTRRIEQRRKEAEALCNLQEQSIREFGAGRVSPVGLDGYLTQEEEERSIIPFAHTPHVAFAAHTALLQLLRLQLLLLLLLRTTAEPNLKYKIIMYILFLSHILVS